MSAPGEPAARPPDGAAHGVTLARGALANAVALVAASFRAVFTLSIARLLGDAALGTFALAFAATDLLSKVATFGLDNAATALVARSRGRAAGPGPRPVIASALRLGAVASTVTAVLGIATLLLLGRRLALEEPLARATALMLLALPGIAFYRIATGISRGFGVMRHDIYSRGLAETWTTILVFLAAYAAGVRALAPVLAVVAGTGTGAVVALRLARGLYGRSAQQASGHSDREVLSFALPIAVYGLLNLLIMRLDVLVLGAFVSRAPGVTLASFGVYCAAVEVTGGLRKARQVFEPAFAPQVAMHAHDSGGALRSTMGQTGRWLLAAVLPLVGLLLVSGRLVLSAFGPGFREGALWLALLALAQGASALAGLVETVIMVRRPSWNVLNSAVVAAAHLLATLLLVPRLGMLGAALGTLVAYTLMAVLRFFELRHVVGRTWPWASLARPALAFAAAFVPALLVRFAVRGLAGDAAAGLVLLAAYALAWWRLGLEPEDRLTLARLRRRQPATEACGPG